MNSPLDTPAVDPTPLDNIRIVMVHTSHPGNIGAAARAMKNMGLSQLYIVAPKNYPHEDAYFRAANAVDVLARAVVVDTFEEAIAGCSLVVGSSARERRIPWPLLDSRRACEQAYREARNGAVALVFGREDRGLTNEELQQCQLHVNIPASEAYSSLNVAMAIQVLAYEVRMAHLAGKLPGDTMEGWDIPYAGADDVERLFTHMEEALLEMNFLKESAPKQAMARLRRLFQRTRLDQMEVNILRGIFTIAQQWVRGERY
jgi:tRNA (cytidine32/uridine32-2'-O)-methyltransferase